MASLPTVLIFTYAEYGQANVNLATSYELALAGINVCIASFASLEPRVARLQELINRHRNSETSADDRPTGSVHFRECSGFPSFMEAVLKHGQSVATFQHPHGVSGALMNYSMLTFSIFPWTKDEYLAAIESIKEVISSVKPNVVVIDTVFQIAMDACRVVGQPFIVMLANSIKDIATNSQPYLAGLWKYPACVASFFDCLSDQVIPVLFDSVSSGFPFPLSWWQVPLNIYLNVRLALQMVTSERVRQFQDLRRSLGIEPLLPMQLCPGVTHILPSLPEMDFPFDVIPREMTLCGPILMPFDPLEESDPALLKWLENGPTVMINLGSHALCDEAFAREMAGAFRILLDYHDRKGNSKIQLLWKAKASDDARKTIDELVGKEIQQGRVKVVAWLDAEPIAILQHPNVVCTVHHGGANSYFEGIWSGLPHIVLPIWTDTYDYAARVEFLNIGVFASKTSAPGVRAEELGPALMRVTGETEAREFRQATKRLKEVCRAKGSGRKLASLAIVKELGMAR